MTRRDGLAGSALLAASALLWGTLWIPLRALDAAGAGAALPTACAFALPFALLAPFARRRGPALRRAGPALPAAGLGLALSISLYAEGLVRGSVPRVVILFYLMPLWTTLLARLHLAQPVTPRRLAALALGLAGLAAVYGPDAAGGSRAAAGDWMGLASGFAWAATLVFLLPAARTTAFDGVLAQFAFLAPVYLLVSALPGGEAAPGARSGAALAPALAWLVAFSFVWLLPAVWLTVAGARRLEPGRAAILLTFEIAVALASSALLAADALAPREALGAVLVAGAGALEAAAPSARAERPPPPRARAP